MVMVRTQKMHAYAEALLRVSSEIQSTVDWNEQAWKIYQVLKKNERFVQIIADKQFDLPERQQLIDDVFGKSGEFHPIFVNFLKVLADNDVFLSAGSVLRIFIELNDEKNHVRYVKVYSAFALSDEELSRLEKALCHKLQVQKVLINNVVDPKLLCGAKVVTESHTIDNSLRGKMDLILKEILAHKLNLTNEENTEEK